MKFRTSVPLILLALVLVWWKSPSCASPVYVKWFQEVEKQAYDRLRHGIKSSIDPFADVLVSLPLGSPIVRVGDGRGQADKTFAPNIVNYKHCVVYGAGVSGDIDFENDLASKGCKVYAFDCTIQAPPPSPNVTFHKICLGRAETAKFSGLEFSSLADMMKQLGHSQLDIFKFDIEGHEWNLIESEILQGTARPRQILFELHTDGSNPKWVDADIVKGKQAQQVNDLMLKLHEIGYRVISKEVNNGDSKCAEISMLYIY